MVALLVLLSWTLRRWRLGALGSGYVPMAPSTAGLIILLGGAIFVYNRWPGLATRYASLLAAVSTGGISLLMWVQNLRGVEPSLEKWLVPAVATTAGIPVGRM